MKVLFDQGTPVPLRRLLEGHAVRTAYEMGWSEMSNGQLLAVAEELFDVMVTTDRNLSYQQNLVGRRLAIIVLPTTSWPRIKRNASWVIEAVERVQPGDFIELGPLS